MIFTHTIFFLYDIVTANNISMVQRFDINSAGLMQDFDINSVWILNSSQNT